MRYSWALCGVLLLGACGADAPEDAADALDGADVEESAPADLTATIAISGADPSSFVANVLVSCSFEKPGQLRIAGSAVSAEGTANLSVRIGTEDSAVPTEGVEFPVTGVSAAEDVLAGEAAIAWVDGDVEPAIALNGTVTLLSVDPCEGAFEARLGLAGGGEMDVEAGVFWIARDFE